MPSKNNFIENIINFINKSNTTVLIFIVLCFSFLGIHLGGNEENYLAYAKQFMSPEWIPNSFTLTDIPGTRILFQYIFGFLLKFFSFEIITFSGRLLTFILFAHVFSKLIFLLKIKNLNFLFVFIVIFFSNQSFFAGGWMLGNIEGKVFAYFLILYSIYFCLKQEHVKAIILIAFSIYWHILIGGWFVLIYFIYLLIVKTKFKNLFKYGVIFALIVLPFVVYLFKSYFTGQPNVINGINITKVYVFVRNAHHIGIFKSFYVFRKYYFDGVIISFLFYLLCIFYFSRFKDEKFQILNKFNIILFSQQFISILIAAFDQNGYFLKYYPFRTSVISMILLLFQLILYFQLFGNNLLFKKSSQNRVYINKLVLKTIILFLTASYFIIISKNNFKKSLKYISKDNYALMQTKELNNYIKGNTSADAVFINYTNYENLSFSRNTNREQFFVYKFVPTTNKLIYEWYMRKLDLEKVLENINYIDEMRKIYKIDYVISKEPLQSNLINIWNNNSFYIYK